MVAAVAVEVAAEVAVAPEVAVAAAVEVAAAVPSAAAAAAASEPAGAVVAVVTVKRISDRLGEDWVSGGAEGRGQGGVQAVGAAIGEDLGQRQTRQGQIPQ